MTAWCIIRQQPAGIYSIYLPGFCSCPVAVQHQPTAAYPQLRAQFQGHITLQLRALHSVLEPGLELYLECQPAIHVVYCETSPSGQVRGPAGAA